MNWTLLIEPLTVIAALVLFGWLVVYISSRGPFGD